MQVKQHSEQLNTCLNDWDYLLGAMHKLPPDDSLVSRFFGHTHKSQSLRDEAAYYIRLEKSDADRKSRPWCRTSRSTSSRHEGLKQGRRFTRRCQVRVRCSPPVGRVATSATLVAEEGHAHAILDIQGDIPEGR